MKNVVGAVLYKNNQFILAKRDYNSKSYPGLFEFPGGKVEKGETKKKALIRELIEELDIIVKEKDVIDFKNNTEIHYVKNLDMDIFLTLFLVTDWNGEMKIKKGIHSDLVYLNQNQLLNFEGFIPGDSKFVKPILKSLNGIN